METEVKAVIIKEQNERLKQENEQLKSQLRELQRLMFGSKSERFVSTAANSQIDLFTGTAPSDQVIVKQEEIKYTRTVSAAKKQKPYDKNSPHTYLEL